MSRSGSQAWAPPSRSASFRSTASAAPPPVAAAPASAPGDDSYGDEDFGSSSREMESEPTEPKGQVTAERQATASYDDSYEQDDDGLADIAAGVGGLDHSGDAAASSGSGVLEDGAKAGADESYGDEDFDA